ncbi:MAG: peptidoglycan editing factor PgeF [Thermodesulfobacteriota bacterium]
MNSYKSELLSSFSNLKQGFIPNFNHDEIGLVAYDSGLSSIQTVNQIHSDKILKISNEDLIFSEGDSLYTDLKGVGVGIYTADCLPIIYFAEEINIVGAIHAGWRGTLNEIATKTFIYLIQELNCKSSKIYVAIGPSIEGNCYEVGEEVAEQFINKFDNVDLFLTKKNNTKFKLDLKEANNYQLQSTGITHIDLFGNCTFCDKTLPSYRRDGRDSGRILSFIGFV